MTRFMLRISARPLCFGFALAPVLFTIACNDSGADDDVGTTTMMGGSETDELGADELGADELGADETGADETETDTGEPEPICGNGVVEGSELCDDGNDIDDDACSNSCQPRECPPLWLTIDGEKTVSGSSLAMPRLAELPDGNIVMALAVDGELGIDIGVRVHTPEGELVWSVIHQWGALRDSLGDVVVDSSGDIYMSGSADAGYDGVATVVRLSGADGSELWRFQQDGPVLGAFDGALGLALDDQGRLLAAIAASDDQGQTDVELHALDAADGSSQWVGRWAGSGPSGASDDSPFELVFDAARGRAWVYVTSQQGADSYEPILLAFEAAQTQPVLVAQPLTYVDPESALPRALVLDEQGEVWVGVQAINPGQWSKGVIGKLDPSDGSVVQVIDTHDLPLPGDNHQAPNGSFSAGPGGFALAGWIVPDPALGVEHAGYVQRLDGEGSPTCTTFVDGHSNNLLFTSLVAASGRVYASGYLSQSGDWLAVLLRTE